MISVVNLTLVDLPGLTHVATAGQNPNVPAIIERIVLQYISRPSVIVLAVHAATADIATSDSLKLAREVDPSGLGMCGVLHQGLNE